MWINDPRKDGATHYNEVIVRARVAKFFSFTELTSASALSVLRTGVDLNAEIAAVRSSHLTSWRTPTATGSAAKGCACWCQPAAWRSTGVTYWEGATDVAGSSNGRPIRGRGYLEMTGYTGAPMSDKFE